MTMGSPTGFPATSDHPLSTFSALNLLRNYNHLLAPSGANLVQVYHHYSCGSSSFGDFQPDAHTLPSAPYPLPPVIGTFHSAYGHYPVPSPPSSLAELKSSSSGLPTSPYYGRRPRGEKKPIPDDQKDDRYYERRKRNNQAAKKSRDARKFREDQIALRATLLEHENAVLRAQVLTLREEAQSLRRHILNEKIPDKYGKVDGDGLEYPGTKWKSEYDDGR